jgi:hypothetical protein
VFNVYCPCLAVADRQVHVGVSVGVVVDVRLGDVGEGAAGLRKYPILARAAGIR